MLFSKGIKRLLILTLCISIAGAGCAGTKGNIIGYSEENPEAKKFKDLSDREALNMVVVIYNVEPRDNEDNLAKTIAIQTYMAEMKKRKSKYLKESGIFEVEVTEIDLKKWDDKKVAALYKYLDDKIYAGAWDRLSELPGDEKDLMVIRMTARDVLYKEGRTRDVVRQSAEVAGHVLMTALSIAASMI